MARCTARCSLSTRMFYSDGFRLQQIDVLKKSASIARAGGHEPVFPASDNGPQ